MYDTLSITGSKGKKVDTLILSQYSKPKRLTAEILSEITVEEIRQNEDFLADTMFFKVNRLYEIKNGRIVTEKQRGIRRGSEQDPWYFRLAK